MPVSPFIEPLSGTCDGVNTTFSTSMGYVSGSIQIFRNGLLLQQDLDDGWTEIGSRQIMMNIAPLAGDILQAYYQIA